MGELVCNEPGCENQIPARLNLGILPTWLEWKEPLITRQKRSTTAEVTGPLQEYQPKGYWIAKWKDVRRGHKYRLCEWRKLGDKNKSGYIWISVSSAAKGGSYSIPSSDSYSDGTRRTLRVRLLDVSPTVHALFCPICGPVVAKTKKEQKERMKAQRKREKAHKELIKSREGQLTSYVKAGIPESIVSLWVEGTLEEHQMLELLSIFLDSFQEWEEIVNLVIIKKPESLFLKNSECLTWGRQLLDLSKINSLEWIHEFVKREFDKSDIDFIETLIQTNDFQFLETALINEAFLFEEAKNLFYNCGFEDNPGAFEEVVNGANWRAVAVKHGFFQL